MMMMPTPMRMLRMTLVMVVTALTTQMVFYSFVCFVNGFHIYYAETLRLMAMRVALLLILNVKWHTNITLMQPRIYILAYGQHLMVSCLTLASVHVRSSYALTT